MRVNYSIPGTSSIYENSKRVLRLSGDFQIPRDEEQDLRATRPKMHLARRRPPNYIPPVGKRPVLPFPPESRRKRLSDRFIRELVARVFSPGLSARILPAVFHVGHRSRARIMRGGGGRGRRRKLSGDARYTSNGDKFPRKIFTDAKLYRFLGPRRGRGSERREVDGELEGRDAFGCATQVAGIEEDLSAAPRRGG